MVTGLKIFFVLSTIYVFLEYFSLLFKILGVNYLLLLWRSGTFLIFFVP